MALNRAVGEGNKISEQTAVSGRVVHHLNKCLVCFTRIRVNEVIGNGNAAEHKEPL